jgi:hypothetical protein
LKDADAKEWMGKLEEQHPNKKLSFADKDFLLKNDTVKRNDGTILLIRQVKSIYTYGGNQFAKTFTDTTQVKADYMLKVISTQVSAPVYSDKILSAALKWKFIFLVWVMIFFVTMVYGPVAAFLVELFPTKIRYTSMSLPYHIGNGVFGGLVPFIATLLSTTFTSDPLVGLWYPIGVAALCFVIGTLYLTNKVDKNIHD